MRTLAWLATNNPGITIYKIFATLKNVKTQDISKLSLLSDDKTGRVPIALYIYIGQPVIIHDNQYTEGGIVNGGDAKIHYLQWQDGATFSKPPDQFYYLPSKPPTNIFV